MSKDVQCTVTNGERAELFRQVFGTPTVYLEDPVGEYANLPGLGERHIYKLDMAEVTPDQRAKLISILAPRFGIPESQMPELVDAYGVPILADDCVLTITGAAARSLLPDDMEWEDE